MVHMGELTSIPEGEEMAGSKLMALHLERGVLFSTSGKHYFCK